MNPIYPRVPVKGSLFGRNFILLEFALYGAIALASLFLIKVSPWLGVAVNGLSWAYAFYLIWREWSAGQETARRTLQNRCLECGYDLTGLTGSICPECGASVIPLPMLNELKDPQEPTRPIRVPQDDQVVEFHSSSRMYVVVWLVVGGAVGLAAFALLDRRVNAREAWGGVALAMFLLTLAAGSFWQLRTSRCVVGVSSVTIHSLGRERIVQLKDIETVHLDETDLLVIALRDGRGNIRASAHFEETVRLIDLIQRRAMLSMKDAKPSSTKGEGLS